MTQTSDSYIRDRALHSWFFISSTQAGKQPNNPHLHLACKGTKASAHTSTSDKDSHGASVKMIIHDKTLGDATVAEAISGVFLSAHRNSKQWSINTSD